ncbi:hypothetical protein EDC04DRAFT_2676493 [Pisolithus marmoratus]|nr:hypothetical protein EDC04DRAFT_2676493 [Pisolithus marmoratus]
METEHMAPTDSDRKDSHHVVQRFHRCIFRTLLGTDSLESLRQISEKNEKAWSKLKDRLTDRTININIVAALAVAATASFLTNPPPTDFAKWDHQFPYFCVAASNGSAMLAVISGLGLLIFLNAMDSKSIIAAQTSKFKFVILVTLLMMPLTFLATATLWAGLAWIGAVWLGDKFWIQLAVTLGCIVFLVTLFVISAALY